MEYSTLKIFVSLNSKHGKTTTTKKGLSFAMTFDRLNFQNFTIFRNFIDLPPVQRQRVQYLEHNTVRAIILCLGLVSMNVLESNNYQLIKCSSSLVSRCSNQTTILSTEFFFERKTEKNSNKKDDEKYLWNYLDANRLLSYFLAVKKTEFFLFRHKTRE